MVTAMAMGEAERKDQPYLSAIGFVLPFRIHQSVAAIVIKLQMGLGSAVKRGASLSIWSQRDQRLTNYENKSKPVEP